MLLDYELTEAAAESTCSDCGRTTIRPMRGVDMHTHSEVQLCPDCVPAFMHRQQFPAGCCGA
jgi:hypothetical protein